MAKICVKKCNCFFFLEEIAKLSEIFTAAETTTTTSRQIERTSIRTYYSNVDLSSQQQQQTQHGRVQVQAGADIPSTYRKDQYYAQQQRHHTEDLTNGVQSQRRQSHHQHQEDFYNHYDELNERVRSPSLPPIGRMKIK